MISTGRLFAISAWLGFALAALFLYPLAVALASDIFYMQWQPRDTAETIVAWSLLAIVFGALVFALWRRPGRDATIALGLVAALPMASFLAGLSRQLPFQDELIGAWGNPLLRFGLPAAAVAGGLVALARIPETVGRWLRRGLLALSFVSVVVVQTFVAAASYETAPVDVRRQAAASAPADPGAACPPILALLFDELSFAYLYDGDEVRAEFPALRRLAATGTSYTSVRAPADETLVSIPAFLAGRHVERVSEQGIDLYEVDENESSAPLDFSRPDALFPTARRLGYTTEIGGYYLPYCRLLGGLADVCRSLSFYNASSAEARFSPLNPIVTTLVMWPRQFPFGLVKNRPFARVQRGLVETLSAFARRPMRAGPPVFRFVHFSIPHLPFVFDEEGYDPPLDPLRTSPDDSYVRQLRYVDRVVGEIVGDLERAGTLDRTMVLVLADHGFRFGGRERDAMHIPFIMKRAGQRTRRTIAEPQRGELLLRQVVAGSCERS